MTNQDAAKLQTYPEFIKANGSKECSGCLESLVDYIENYLPRNFTDYECLQIPKGLLGQYYDSLSRATIGERSL
jgi:hypothetical protein